MLSKAQQRRADAKRIRVYRAFSSSGLDQYASESATSCILLLNASATADRRASLECYLRTQLSCTELLSVYSGLFALLVFKTSDEASLAYDLLHEKPFHSYDDRLLFLVYVKDAILQHLFSSDICKVVQKDPKVVLQNYLDIPGLSFVQEFMNEEEEQFLLHRLKNDQHPWIMIKERKVVRHYAPYRSPYTHLFQAQYGAKYDYETFNTDSSRHSFPDYVQVLSERLLTTFDRPHYVPNQLTIQVYEPGVGIRKLL